MRDLDRILGDAADAGRHASTPLPPAQIRGVAARVRRARTATTAVLSAVAVTAVVVAVTTAGVPDAAPEIIDSPSPTETTTTTTPPSATPPPTTTPPPTEPPAGPILDGNMLSADQLDPLYFGGVDSVWIEADPALSPRCTPALDGDPIEAGHIAFTYGASDELQIEQWAEAYAVPDQAAARLDRLRADLGDCAEADDEIALFVASTITGVGDAGFMADLYEPYPGFADTSIYSTVRAAQTGRVVTWTQYAQVKPEILDPSEVAELAIAVERLCELSGGSCVGEPALIRTYPNADDPGAPGLVTEEEVNSALPGSWRSETVGAPPGDVPEVCSPESLADAAAVEILGRTFVDDGASDPDVTGVRVTWGELGSFEFARDYARQQPDFWVDCVVDGVRPVRLSPSSNDYRFDFGDRHMYTGFVHVGSYVLVVQWNATLIDDEAFRRLQARAHERLSRFVQ